MLNLAVPWPKRTPRQSCAETGPPERYDEDFKNEAVRLVTTGQRSVPDVARSLGISENILYRWKGHTNKVDRSPNGISQQDYDQLWEQLRRTEQERDILKKA
ncbi:transposase, partial [Spirosoma terrae]